MVALGARARMEGGILDDRHVNYNANHATAPSKEFLAPLEQELIQICMHLYNKYEKKDDEPGWYSLKNTFAIL